MTPNKKTTVKTLLEQGVSQREISRKTGIDRKTIHKYAKEFGHISETKSDSKSPTQGEVATGSDSKSPTQEEVATGSNSKSPTQEEVATGSDIQDPPQPLPVDKSALLSKSACETHREWIETQVSLKRNAVSIYQDLVEKFDFSVKYNSVKRFVWTLKARNPEQFDRLDFDPGQEAQVDYGLGTKTLDPKGKYRRPRLFVMTLKYSGRAFRKTVWKSSQETWARHHEEAFRYFGGATRYVVLDNLKEGVITPDIFEPELNPVYAAMLAHYNVVADTARVRDPNRKGTVENAVKHTQNTALKGRTFESIEAQNQWLTHWEERWAATRIHGRAKRQVEAMFQEEKPHLLGLPLTAFRYFKQEIRTVYDDGMILVDNSYYSALPAPLLQKVTVRIYTEEIEIIDPKTQTILRRHSRSTERGSVAMLPEDRIFNPSRQTDYFLGKAEQIGPETLALCKRFFAEEGRIGARRMQGMVNLARHYEARVIEQAAQIANRQEIQSLKTMRALVKNIALRGSERPNAVLSEAHALIRPPEDYGAFFDRYAAVNPPARLTRAELPVVWQNASWHKVIEVFGLQVDTRRRAKPREIWIKSPFTDEKTASLHLDLSRNVYKDFSGQRGGGILIFCQEMLRQKGAVMNCYEVAAYMIEKGISQIHQLPGGDAEKQRKPEENLPIRTDLRPFLRTDHPALVQRGIDPGTCRYLGCGFLERSGAPLSGRLVFQVRGVRPEAAGLKPVILTHAGRALSSEQAESDGKYWSYPFHKRLEIYNQDHLMLEARAGEQLSARGLILVEGFFDVAALVGAGCLNVGALMGTELSDRQIERLKQIDVRIGMPKITLFFDRDHAGETGSEKAARKLAESGFTIEVFDWNQEFRRPDGTRTRIPESIQDPAEMSVRQLQWLRAHGAI